MMRLTPSNFRPAAGNHSRGTILVVTMWIMLVLTALVLVLARSMRVEAVCSANDVASLQARAVEQGAIQYVLAHLDSLSGAMPTDDDMPAEGVQVGQGAFWIVRPNFDSDTVQQFGVVDEASKINLNATVPTSAVQRSAMLLKLPNMTDELVASIADWRDKDSTVTTGGAESEYYMTLSDPYQCKNGAFETVEELFLVKGMDETIVYGEDANRNGMLDDNENDGDQRDPSDNGDSKLDRGLVDFVTVYSSEPASSGGGSGGATSAPTTAVKGRININTAPKEVLMCLPGLDENDAAALVARRSQGSFDTTTTAWAREVLSTEKYNRLSPPKPTPPPAPRPGAPRPPTPPQGDVLITAKSYQFSADIVSVSLNGRAMRRCRIVVDASASPPKVIYRQDLTHLGWPLAKDILDRLRAGAALSDVVSTQTPLQETSR